MMRRTKQDARKQRSNEKCDKVHEESCSEYEGNICMECEEEIREVQPLLCDRCDERYCRSCVNMSYKQYSFIQKREDAFWFCKKCVPGVTKAVTKEKGDL